MNDFYLDDSGYPCFSPEIEPDYVEDDGYEVEEIEPKTGQELADMLAEMSGNKITFGYIGNIEQWGDDRSFRLFRKYPTSCDSIGGFDNGAQLLADFRRSPARYFEWATK
jgi:hypothetical protein